MRPTVSTGDLALTALPATPETFEPYGRVLEPGTRAFLGKRGRVLVTLDARRRAPRRISHLQRYPEAKRAVVATAAIASWIVVLAPGEKPEARPAAFLVPAGAGLIIHEGVWHAGPVPLEDAVLCEMLEAIGAADRFDRKSVRELVDAEAVRVLLPEDPGAPPGGLDLLAPGAVQLDASLHGRMRLGLLVVDGLALDAETPPALAEELSRAAEGLRAMWGQPADLGEIPGVALGRDLHQELGLDVSLYPPRVEPLLAGILAGQDPVPGDSRLAIATLCMLRSLAPLSLYDPDGLAQPVVARIGADGEGYTDPGRRRLELGGRPLLADAAGPFGSPLGDSARTAPGSQARRVLAVLYLPPSVSDAAIQGLLDGVARAFVGHAGGSPGDRLVVG